jgi:hypothetical protein
VQARAELRFGTAGEDVESGLREMDDLEHPWGPSCGGEDGQLLQARCLTNAVACASMRGAGTTGCPVSCSEVAPLLQDDRVLMMAVGDTDHVP